LKLERAASGNNQKELETTFTQFQALQNVVESNRATTHRKLDAPALSK